MPTSSAPRKSLADAVAALHAGIRRERRPLLLPLELLSERKVRRWAAAVLTAEVKHAEADFWHAVHRLGGVALFDRYRREDEAAPFRLPHEVMAGKALNWLGHLQSEEWMIGEAARQTRPPVDPAYLRKLRIAWIGVARSFLKAVAQYRALRIALDAPLAKAA